MSTTVAEGVLLGRCSVSTFWGTLGEVMARARLCELHAVVSEPVNCGLVNLIGSAIEAKRSKLVVTCTCGQIRGYWLSSGQR